MENKDIQRTMKQTRFKKRPFDIELAKKYHLSIPKIK